MKKHFLLILCLVMVLISAVLLSACGETGGDDKTGNEIEIEQIAEDTYNAMTEWYGYTYSQGGVQERTSWYKDGSLFQLFYYNDAVEYEACYVGVELRDELLSVDYVFESVKNATLTKKADTTNVYCYVGPYPFLAASHIQLSYEITIENGKIVKYYGEIDADNYILVELFFDDCSEMTPLPQNTDWDMYYEVEICFESNDTSSTTWVKSTYIGEYLNNLKDSNDNTYLFYVDKNCTDLYVVPSEITESIKLYAVSEDADDEPDQLTLTLKDLLAFWFESYGSTTHNYIQVYASGVLMLGGETYNMALTEYFDGNLVKRDWTGTDENFKVFMESLTSSENDSVCISWLDAVYFAMTAPDDAAWLDWENDYADEDKYICEYCNAEVYYQYLLNFDDDGILSLSITEYGYLTGKIFSVVFLFGYAPIDVTDTECECDICEECGGCLEEECCDADGCQCDGMCEGHTPTPTTQCECDICEECGGCLETECCDADDCQCDGKCEGHEADVDDFDINAEIEKIAQDTLNALTGMYEYLSFDGNINEAWLFNDLLYAYILDEKGEAWVQSTYSSVSLQSALAYMFTSIPQMGWEKKAGAVNTYYYINANYVEMTIKNGKIIKLYFESTATGSFELREFYFDDYSEMKQLPQDIDWKSVDCECDICEECGGCLETECCGADDCECDGVCKTYVDDATALAAYFDSMSSALNYTLELTITGDIARDMFGAEKAHIFHKLNYGLFSASAYIELIFDEITQPESGFIYGSGRTVYFYSYSEEHGCYVRTPITLTTTINDGTNEWVEPGTYPYDLDWLNGMLYDLLVLSFSADELNYKVCANNQLDCTMQYGNSEISIKITAIDTTEIIIPTDWIDG